MSVTPSTLLGVERPVCLRFESTGPRGGTFRHRLLLDDAGGWGHVAIESFDGGWAAFYHWPHHARGRKPLLEFLLQCDLHYLAGKFKLDREFDRRATEDAVKAELRDGNPEEYERLAEDAEWMSLDAFRDWLTYQAPPEPGDRFARFSPHYRVQFDFEIFYQCAWPVLRERKAEIEALLYPDGVATASQETGR